MRKVIIPSHESYKYAEVFVVTEYKDGYVYSTRSIGYADRKDIESGLCPLVEGIVLSSISTKLTKKDKIDLRLLSLKEIEEIVAATKVR